jgi:hypothetical protein
MELLKALTFFSAILSILISFITSFFAYPEVSILFLIIGYYFSFYVVVQTIGNDNGWYHSALKFYFIILIVTVFIFAIIYWRYGLISNSKKIDISFFNAIYFSLTTWTTLGYGDFAPIPRLRHITSFEAISGYIGLGLFITLLTGYMNNMIKSSLETKKHNQKIIKKHHKKQTYNNYIFSNKTLEKNK